jgi:hypothetical protein
MGFKIKRKIKRGGLKRKKRSGLIWKRKVMLKK